LYIWRKKGQSGKYLRNFAFVKEENRTAVATTDWERRYKGVSLPLNRSGEQNQPCPNSTVTLSLQNAFPLILFTTTL
jgi:hypothetical protein